MKPAVSETNLNAYLDGQLPPDQTTNLEARFAEDAEASNRLDAMTEQKKMLRAALMAMPASEDRRRHSTWNSGSPAVFGSGSVFPQEPGRQAVGCAR